MIAPPDLTTKAAEIRAGLVADWRKAMEGVTPGPWFMKDFDTELSVSTTDGSAPLIADLIEQGDAQEPGHWGSEYQIGQWIARCSPAGIAPLLAFIEQQAAELAEARADLAAQIAGHRHSAKEATTLLIERKARAKERDSIVASGEALVAALSRYGFPMSEEAWRNTGDEAPVNSQASVEARALHRAAAAFFREISGAHHE